jgi:alpha-tubulin suppressor-like RCC1 family protein
MNTKVNLLVVLVLLTVLVGFPSAAAQAQGEAVYVRPAVAGGGYHTCELKADGTLACWGSNTYGQATVPEPNENWAQVSAGMYHTCGLKVDGTLQCWGRNTSGETTVPAPNEHWAQVSAGAQHTCGLKDDGTLQCWGDNFYSQDTVPAPNEKWVQVSAYLYHTCGLKADGTLQCWGTGQTIVPEPNENWVQVSVGGQHICGLKVDGTLTCWGRPNEGQIAVPEPNESWAQVSAGTFHTCGLKVDGTLQCWGRNTSGETAVPDPNENWAQVSAGGAHTCGLKADGTLQCWGYNADGQAPVITLAPDLLPDTALGAAYTQNISASGGSATPYAYLVISGAVPTGLTLNADGTWSGAPSETGTFNFTVQALDANNIAGRRDYAITVDKVTTTTTLAFSQAPSLLSEPVSFTAVVSPAPDGGTVAFKDNGVTITGCEAQPLNGGQAACTTSALTAGTHIIHVEYSGSSNYAASASAVRVQAVYVRPAVAAGGYHTCELKADGTLQCWGSNSYGHATVPAPNADWAQVSAGAYHTCGLKADGTLACWGDNDYGQTTVPAPNESWAHVSAGAYHTCGLKVDGTLQCWGFGSSGQTNVTAPNADWAQVSAGAYHTCGLKDDGTLQCWGLNSAGQTTVPAPNESWAQVSAGAQHTCGLKVDSTLTCWGRPNEMQTTVPAPNTDWVQVSAGMFHTCGLKDDGTLQCWGSNSYGIATVPAPNADWVQVSAGGAHTCGLKDDGTLLCWGYNADGQAPVTPHISVISPASAEYGSDSVTLAVSGSNFTINSVVRWNGADLATTFESDSQLTATIADSNLASVQTAQVTVYTPGGGTSDVLAFFVTQAAADVTGQDVASGTDPSAESGPATANATGDGLLAVAQYDSNPGGTPSFTASGTYFDVYTAPDSSFSQVEIVACNLNGGNKLYWWDAGQGKWQKANPQSYDPSTGCVTLVVDADSSPSLSQLQGTVFAAGSNTAPIAEAGGPYLGAVNTAIAFDGSDSFDADGDPLTYAWTFGDNGTGSVVNPTHSYVATGIYDVCLTVSDGSLALEPACTLAVVYDPSGGFVTGGGWIDSPAGAYTLDPSLSGRATFGFVSKYRRGATVPEGNTEFQFQASGFNFHSTSYEWLVVNQDRTNAQFKGSGTVNGDLDLNENAYKFMLWAGDGSPDTFRIRIWWEAADGTENVVYDNGFNQAIGGGSIVVHTGK